MVHFVGAGPGAPDLITIRGARLLAEADVVIWAGSLVNAELLDACKAGCERYDSSRMTLEEVIAVMCAAHGKGQEVVRLHTGDPSLYGAIREQMDALEKASIPFDVTPGVSSFSGAAAALCCEYTLPGVSQSVIITREEGRTKVPDAESLVSLAAHNTTLVLFLSAGYAEQVQRDLLAAGRSERTPVAIVYRASWPDERIVRCTVGTLAQSANEAGISRTALIVVGDVLGASMETLDEAQDETRGDAPAEIPGGSRDKSASTYERSKLYDPSFSTGYRKGGN